MVRLKREKYIKIMNEEVEEKEKIKVKENYILKFFILSDFFFYKFELYIIDNF